MVYNLLQRAKTYTNPSLKVAYCDFWGGLDLSTLRIHQVLVNYFKVTIDHQCPDLVIYSCFGNSHKKYDMHKVVKIFLTYENIKPNFNDANYAITFDRCDYNGKNLYAPLGLIRHEGNYISLSDKELLHRRFCSFIGQFSYQHKLNFINKLSQRYKKVDCPGRAGHNMDAPELLPASKDHAYRSKVSFLRKYKFSIAFENGSTDGYITEKVTNALEAGTIPIYFGSDGNLDPVVPDKRCLICVNDFDNLDQVIDRIIELDTNEKEYLKVCSYNPYKTENTLFLTEYDTLLVDFIKKIILENKIESAYAFTSGSH